MSDVKLAIKDLRYDIEFVLGNLETDDGLETAVNISLFTDRRVLGEELETGETDRRGWWGDALDEQDGDSTGSRLWLLDRAKPSEETRNRAEAYAKEALQWLLDEGVAETLTVLATLVNKNERIDLNINITRPKVKNAVYYRYQLVWEGQLLNARKA